MSRSSRFVLPGGGQNLVWWFSNQHRKKVRAALCKSSEISASGGGGRILTLPPGRSADFPVRSNVERQEGFRRLLERWEARGLCGLESPRSGGGARMRPNPITMRLPA